MSITFEVTGGNETEKWLEKAYDNLTKRTSLRKYGELGVQALQRSTPKETGLTAASWYYEIKESNDGFTIEWKNRNSNKGVLIAAILQYGHGTGTGGYVRGVDYINPAMKPVFQQIADDAWKEVTK